MKCIGEDRWIPDFESRYFTADFSFGLKIIKELCDLFSVDHENITEVWNWYQSVAQENAKEAFSLDLGKDECIAQYV